VRSISARRTAARSRSDSSDIPKLSDERLRTLQRVSRPPIGVQARQFAAIGLEPEALNRCRAEARRLGIGYQTLMDRVLAADVGARVA
jgi:hypothetical protein